MTCLPRLPAQCRKTSRARRPGEIPSFRRPTLGGMPRPAAPFGGDRGQLVQALLQAGVGGQQGGQAGPGSDHGGEEERVERLGGAQVAGGDAGHLAGHLGKGGGQRGGSAGSNTDPCGYLLGSVGACSRRRYIRQIRLRSTCLLSLEPFFQSKLRGSSMRSTRQLQRLRRISHSLKRSRPGWRNKGFRNRKPETTLDGCILD